METDFCVVGGGLAGVCAALAAARDGSRVVLIQDRSTLGGNASSEIRMHIVGASCSGRRPGARETGLIEEIRLQDAVQNRHRSPHLFDLLLYDLVRSEPNLQLLLDTHCIGCEVTGPENSRHLVSVLASRPCAEQLLRITAKFFADCSGDSRLGFEAGADYRIGREASHEFGEPHAPFQADTRTLGSTILFMARKCETAVQFVPPAWARTFTEEDLALRSHRDYEYGYWWAEWGGELDPIANHDEIRHELLAIAMGIWDHVKNHCRHPEADPGAAHDKWAAGTQTPVQSAQNWALDWVGMIPGKRESRRLLGDVVLSENDILGATVWDDQVAYGGWWIDLHPPAGIDAVREFPCEQVEVPYLYSIPLRALRSRNIANLFMAGRNISATHVAFASTRVMGTCATMGQAVGLAASLACRLGLQSTAEVQQRDHLMRLQRALLANDATLLGMGVDRDRGDLALSATIRASSEQTGFAAQLVVNGHSRRHDPALHPGFPECSNQWASHELPAWIELTWSEAVPIGEIHLTFDTGLQRELTLSMSDAFTRRMIRGPQPETVSHYTLSADSWCQDVSENYQRKRIHRLDCPVLTTKLRLDVRRTWGEAFARVFEIRVYPERRLA